MTKQLALTALLMACFQFEAEATEYIFRDLMANTLPSAQCSSETKAKEAASREYTLTRYSKRFCQFQGYGWHLEEIKTAGTTVCTSCGTQTDLQKCHQEDVVVTCKRIKPGSVGMLPGQG